MIENLDRVIAPAGEQGSQWEARKNAGQLTPYVFPNQYGDDRIKQFKKTWDDACHETKVGNRVFHDLRRTAIRNLVKSGVPERVAMMFSGHKTRSVFKRYNIVSIEDLKLSASKQARYLSAQNSYNRQFWDEKKG